MRLDFYLALGFDGSVDADALSNVNRQASGMVSANVRSPKTIKWMINLFIVFVQMIVSISLYQIDHLLYSNIDSFLIEKKTNS